MHVLVATRRTQGTAPGDYAHAMDGELVLLSIPVRDPAGSMHRTHGHHFVGLESREATTTAEVIDLDVSTDAIIGYVRETLSRHQPWNADALAAGARQLGTEMLELAGHFAVGTVVERDDELIIARPSGPRAPRPP